MGGARTRLGAPGRVLPPTMGYWDSATSIGLEGWRQRVVTDRIRR